MNVTVCVPVITLFVTHIAVSPSANLTGPDEHWLELLITELSKSLAIHLQIWATKAHNLAKAATRTMRHHFQLGDTLTVPFYGAEMLPPHQLRTISQILGRCAEHVRRNPNGVDAGESRGISARNVTTKEIKR